MKKERSYSQLKEQQTSERNEADLTSLLDPEFKKKIKKVLKELRLPIEMQITVTRN